MGLRHTKMDENSEYASGRVASEHSLSPQSSALSTIFAGAYKLTLLYLLCSIHPAIKKSGLRQESPIFLTRQSTQRFYRLGLAHQRQVQILSRDGGLFGGERIGG